MPANQNKFRLQWQFTLHGFKKAAMITAAACWTSTSAKGAIEPPFAPILIVGVFFQRSKALDLEIVEIVYCKL